ncbi:molybdopterin molybdotransferase MoeA [Methylococcus sp. EFPC2]|nr:molybdopterin molybdotransferase MoeA [Methylococcus sp. EFPC2]
MADPCAEAGARLLTLDAALHRIVASLEPLQDRERVVLGQAHGRILAQEIVAKLDIPGFANSAMDGYAFHHADVQQAQTAGLELSGASFAGHPHPDACKPGTCIRIFTGAALPEGADTVVMQEKVEIVDGRMVLHAEVKPGENVRPAGDEARAGASLLKRGKRLNAADLGLLAASGIEDILVARKLRVAYFSTGDELRPVGRTLSYGEIHDSNRYTLAALLQNPYLEALDLGVVRDDPDAVKRTLIEASELADVIVSTGGVSVGEADFVSGALAELGQVGFWKLAIKPGKPLAFGQIGKAYFFGLPGNPIASIVTFWQLVRPALLCLAGTQTPRPVRIRATCESHLKKAPGRMEFQRGYFQCDDKGDLTVSISGRQGSHQLLSISAANCLIVLPAESTGVEPGAEVLIEPLQEPW